MLERAPSLDLDIAGVIDVDVQGLVALRRLDRETVTLTGATPIMAALLPEEERR